MTITLAWWMLPTAITLVAIALAMFWPDSGGYFSGLSNLLLLIPALFVSMVAWIAYAILK